MHHNLVGKCSKASKKLQGVENATQPIVKTIFPPLIPSTPRDLGKAENMVKENIYPSHSLLSPLPIYRRYKHLKAYTIIFRKLFRNLQTGPLISKCVVPISQLTPLWLLHFFKSLSIFSVAVTLYTVCCLFFSLHYLL